MIKTYQHPDTKNIKQVPSDNDVMIAAVEKLGYVQITAADITGDPVLTVHYEQVTNPKLPATPPAVPVLDQPVAPATVKRTGEA